MATKKKAPGKKTPKEIIKTLNGEISNVDIQIPSANEFESIRDGQPVFHDAANEIHAIVIDSIIYSTPSRGLSYPKLLELIRRGLGVSEMPYLMKHCNDGHFTIDIGGNAPSWTAVALNNRLTTLEKSCLGKFGSPQYLVSTDFKTENQFIRATESGYLSQKDFKHGTAEKYANGPVYYFAMEYGFEPNDAELALRMGIRDPETLEFVIVGDFTSREGAEAAKAAGFIDNETWQEAQNLGCSTHDQYVAITKHDWPTLSDYNQAKSYGFEEDEAKLYKDLIGVPHYANYLDHIDAGCSASLRVFRTAAEMIDFQHEAGYDTYWKALILNHLRSVKGKTVSYNDIMSVAELEEHPFETGTEAEVLRFLVEDDQVNEIGRAIPRDKKFSLFKNREMHQAIRTAGK